jgi:hypothetical protein
MNKLLPLISLTLLIAGCSPSSSDNKPQPEIPVVDPAARLEQLQVEYKAWRLELAYSEWKKNLASMTSEEAFKKVMSKHFEISKEDHAFLFERFQKIQNPSKDGAEMLQLAKDLIARHPEMKPTPKPVQTPSPSPSPTPSVPPKVEKTMTAPVPVAQTSCKINIPIEEKNPDIYVSEDCKTAFIAPISSLEQGSIKENGDYICDRLEFEQRNAEHAKESMQKYSNLLSQFKEKLAQATTETEKARLQETIKTISSLYNKAARDSQLDAKLIATSVKLMLTSARERNTQAWQAANPTINVLPLRASSSVFEITDKKLVEGLPPIVSISFPGADGGSPPFGPVNPKANYIYLNGGISGFVDISAQAFCTDFRKGVPQEKMAAEYISVRMLTRARALYDNGQSFPINLIEVLN